MRWLLSFLLLVSTIKHSGVLLHTLHSKLHYSFQNNIVPGPNSQWKLVSKSPYRLMEYDHKGGGIEAAGAAMAVPLFSSNMGHAL